MLLSGAIIYTFKLPEIKLIKISAEPEHLFHLDDGRYCYNYKTNWYYLMKNNTFYIGTNIEEGEWAETSAEDIPMEIRWKIAIDNTKKDR